MTDALRETLYALEAALAAADAATAATLGADLPSLLADDFLEFGASGRTWDAATMRETLAGAAPSGPIELLDFAVDELAPGVVLATYRLGEPRPSNRSTIWVRRGGRWQVRFHQGTLRAG